MAVPKKRTSKLKTKIRRNIWKGKAHKIALKAFSLARSILTNRSKSFYYTVNRKSSDSSEYDSTDGK
jgi:large subunit ribosomal protein L32|uniref:Large ribosomal subunit protein bL32c n=1 Tax=Calypogeia fissa TaxID=362796 RepID=A0A4Y5P7G5_CALFD|nr:ribosomal protein L32 [Calypogeia fissa]QCW59215.1 ribosomal protein L32 [Calypogeia fissa]WCP19441.1 ribosomal protein L32 [Calypogeia suecica]WCP19528.1 ribosomal protein L32 [Calypogeia suecica]